MGSAHRSIPRCSFIMVLLALLGVAIGCSDGDPTTPAPEPAEDQLTVSQLAVAGVVGHEATITAKLSGAAGKALDLTVDCSDPAVAAVACEDDRITVTALGTGQAVVTITESGGESRQVPVEVYDPRVLDVGELLLRYYEDFSLVWDGDGLGHSFWRPAPAVLEDGWRAPGVIQITGTGNPSGTRCELVIKADEDADPQSPPLAEPTAYEWLNTPITCRGDWALLHQPTAPDGYLAMGTLLQPVDWGEDPLPGMTVCVRRDLAHFGEAGAAGLRIPPDFICNIMTSNITGSWQIDLPVVPPLSGAYLRPGLFVAWEDRDDPPANHDLMNVLHVALPRLAPSTLQRVQPVLQSHPPLDSSNLETFPIESHEILVPWTLVEDADYADNAPWRWRNSPFYRLERRSFYRREAVYRNETEITQPFGVTVTVGYSEAQSEATWHETGVSIKEEYGIRLGKGPVNADYQHTATVTEVLGYGSQTSVGAFEERSVYMPAECPPGRSVAIYRRFDRFILKRHNGTALEEVESWEVPIDDYRADTYPDGGE